jgi:hypothetical protein
MRVLLVLVLEAREAGVARCYLQWQWVWQCAVPVPVPGGAGSAVLVFVFELGPLWF